MRGLHKIIEKAPDRGRYIMLRLGIGLQYSEKNGSLVLKGETAWHKICGFWVNTPWGCWWIRFRRFRYGYRWGGPVR